MFKKSCFIIGSFFGAGYFPVASGTFGSLVTLPLAFAAAYFFGALGIAVLVPIVFFIGTFATKEILKHTKHDPSLIVIDEVAGQLLTFLPVACFLKGNFSLSALILYGVGFLLFRFFDIVKIQPAKWADEKVNNAWGVMLDDIFAGVYAAAVLYGLKWAVL